MVFLKLEDAAWIDQQMMELERHIKEKTGREVVLNIDSVDNAEDLIIDEILKLTSEVLHVPISKILGKSRKHEPLIARYVSIFLIESHLGEQRAEHLGEIFNRDRTTILNSREQISNMIATKYEPFMEAEKKVRKKLIISQQK